MLKGLKTILSLPALQAVMGWAVKAVEVGEEGMPPSTQDDRPCMAKCKLHLSQACCF